MSKLLTFEPLSPAACPLQPHHCESLCEHFPPVPLHAGVRPAPLSLPFEPRSPVCPPSVLLR
eukprot:3905478-Prymnesium_polylepis.1